MTVSLTKQEALLQIADIVGLEASRMNTEHFRQTLAVIERAASQDPSLKDKLAGYNRLLDEITGDAFQGELKNIIVDVFDGMKEEDVFRYLSQLQYEKEVAKITSELFLRIREVTSRIVEGGATQKQTH